jgi:hypothetical protein
MVYSDENEQVLRLKSMHILYVCNVMSNLHQMIIIVIVSLLQVVDSRARSNADGALQQQARRQLEVFQSQIPGGHLQVIKTQTVSSSRWSNKSSELQEIPIKDFENLQVSSVCLLCLTKVVNVSHVAALAEPTGSEFAKIQSKRRKKCR